MRQVHGPVEEPVSDAFPERLYGAAVQSVSSVLERFSKGLNAVPLERKSIHIRGLPPRDSGEQLASGYVV